MQDTKVSVPYSRNGGNILIGKLEIRDDFSMEGQTYTFNFDVICGTQIYLTVNHNHESAYPQKGCIALREIDAFYHPSE